MGKIYIMRHGDYDSASLRKSLTSKGSIEVHKMAQYLKDQCRVRVKSIWHSPKERAVDTAQIVGQVLDCRNLLEREDLSPNAFPDQLARELQECDRDIVIVSHLPFIPHLLSTIFSQDGQELPSVFSTASVTVIRKTNGRWSLLNFISPEMI